MNRNELIDAVAGKADLSKSSANKAVDAVFESITSALKGGTEVRLVGFGTFSVARRAASVSHFACARVSVLVLFLPLRCSGFAAVARVP